MKKLLIVLLIGLSLAANGIPNGNPVDDGAQVNNNVNNRRKILTQGCVIGGAVFLLAGLGFGSGWVLDHSDQSVNYEIDIDLDLDCEEYVPVVIIVPTPAPTLAPDA